MHLFDFVKFFFVLVLLVVASCGVWQSAENINSAPHVTEEIETGIPFQNKEPDQFQTEIVMTNLVEVEKYQQRYFLARNGAKRLLSFYKGEKNDLSVLLTEDGRSFSINNEKKSYREIQPSGGQKGNELSDFLSTEWRNQKTDAAFEKLGAENNLTKYRVRLANSNASEILIFVDENLKLPVKQEFYSVSGEQKTLMYSVELKNFSLQAEDKLFQLPKDYKAITLK